MAHPSRNYGKLVLKMVGVVVSILLAFGLDAWWESKQRDAEVRDLLLGLAPEFEGAVGELDRVETRNTKVVSAADSLLLTLDGSPGAVEVDAWFLAALFLYPSADPQRGGAEDPGLDSLPESPTVTLQWSQELVSLIQTRRCLSEFILSDHRGLRQALDGIRVELTEALE